ncbi:MAG TPA: SMC-Scp complex subunit ScpB, partial [Gammaproteobacteria bacterium]|nr:SMC-Scp complex subunit ScpB [Gammaproteobacteria bacterium]
FSSERPLDARDLQTLFAHNVDKKDIQSALEILRSHYAERGVELVEVAGGFRFQTKVDHAPALRALRESRPPRYSRALLETLAIIAYRQPMTRGDIEDIRGVTVTTEIMRVLLDREWIRQSGTREVPGHPALYVTTPVFLEYFGLTSLKQLPDLEDERQLADIAKELGIEMPESLAPVPVPPLEDESVEAEPPDPGESEHVPVTETTEPSSAGEFTESNPGGDEVEVREPDADAVTKAALTSEFD